MTTAPVELDLPDAKDKTDYIPVWDVVVWDDPVNLMSYVVWVFRSLFGYDATKATKLMLQVHNDGRAVVDSGPREHAEMSAFRLHHHGLWATLEKR
ncbi:MAG: ATP-dependent Clp protease adapter ClpS [bacterium]|nr:ATP-dependent Clp protease adapter ClpS [bacterium]MCP4966605.1 ATP-dependent Clp protease adapter ClpS [bacterium]